MSDFERWEDELLATGAVRLRTQQSKNVWAIVGCLGFVAAGIFLAMEGRWLVAALAVGFFGVIGLPALAYQLVRPRDVHVTPIQVDVAGTVLPWAQVRGVELGEIVAQRMVVLRLTDDGGAAADVQLGAWARRFQSANRKILGGHALALPTQLRADHQELAAWLALVHHRRVTPSEPVQDTAGWDPDAPAQTHQPPRPAPAPDDHTRFMPPSVRGTRS
jgi:hypothetical protein